MNSLFIRLSSLSLLLSFSTRILAADDDYSDSVIIKVLNYTVDPQMADGGCTEDIDIYLTTYCGSNTKTSRTKSSDSCSETLDYTYTYTESQCDVFDSFSWKWTANNDCDGNWAAYIIGTCAQDYDWAQTSTYHIDDYEFGWNGPYVQKALGGSDDYVAYELYKPYYTIEPSQEPTPSPTVPASSLVFTLCIDGNYAVTTTDDADKIQVRLWTDNDDYQPTEWRNLTSISTLFSSSGACHTFDTFNDIYAQWYLMDLSICSTDGVGITRILYWDMETESQQMVSSFSGDSDCVKMDGDFVMLDGDSTESSSRHATTSTNCQRLDINLSLGSTIGNVDDNSEDSNLSDGTDYCKQSFA